MLHVTMVEAPVVFRLLHLGLIYVYVVDCELKNKQPYS